MMRASHTARDALGEAEHATRLRRAVVSGLLVVLGVMLGAAAVAAWRFKWLVQWDPMAVLAIAIFVNAAIALLPTWREYRQRRRQAELLRFRLWIHFSKLRWLLTHLNEHDSTRPFLSPGCGAEELHGIEVLLAQAHLLGIPEYEWVIFTVNSALPYFGHPIREVVPHAVRLLWTVDATLAQLNRPASNRERSTA
jgi:hypothetical protein